MASGPTGPPYGPKAGAKDLRAVLSNRTWPMGVLRGLDEHEMVATLAWAMAARTPRLSAAPDTGFPPERACCEVYETGRISSQIRH
jgi:hypothetical protein